MLIKALLRAFEPTRANNGREAVELAATGHFDAKLTDMKMPVMGGIEATRKIREFDGTTPIITVTANAFENDKEEALKAGCNMFIPKPIDKKFLEKVLGKL